MSEAEIRNDVVLACRGLAASGMGDMIGGHVSIRVPGEEAYWCNAFDRALAEITHDDVVKVAFDGTVLSPGRYVSVGLTFHSGIYQLRPDVNAIVHSHGHWITAQTAFGRPPQCWHNLATLFEDECAMSPDDTLEAIAPALGDKSTILIPWHGAITVSDTIARAAGLHHTLEYVARLDVTLTPTPATPMPEEMRTGMRDLIMKVGYLEETWQLIRRQGRRALAAEGVQLPDLATAS
ncbi:class II aldolase/adducin family protein [Dactylosporangium sp. CA-139066]|uniref:class II aldolase/adducin family protein n=1 Tax=Dactylosporangium sp. CA-139066 TaxID=3239930 RepID=UPI003D8BB72E